jgi:hypothetical protein
MCNIYNDEPDMIYKYCKKIIPGVCNPSLLDFRHIITCNDTIGVATIKNARCVVCSYVYENLEHTNTICDLCA